MHVPARAGHSLGNGLLGILRSTWENNIRMDLKWDGSVRTGLICLRIGTRDGLLWRWQWTFGLNKTQGTSWVSHYLFASQERLYTPWNCLATKINYDKFSSIVNKHNIYKILRLVSCQVYHNAAYYMSDTWHNIICSLNNLKFKINLAIFIKHSCTHKHTI